MKSHLNAARTGATGWPLALASATIVGTLATHCMMPMVALAVLAAATMPRAHAAITVLGAWAVSQTLGFAVLGYPASGYALGWGAALGVGGLLAMGVGALVLARGGVTLARCGFAFLAAFAAYEAALFAYASVVGGTETFTPAIVAKLFANDALWFVGLMALHGMLTRAAPALFGHARGIRFA